MRQADQQALEFRWVGSPLTMVAWVCHLSKFAMVCLTVDDMAKSVTRMAELLQDILLLLQYFHMHAYTTLRLC